MTAAGRVALRGAARPPPHANETDPDRPTKRSEREIPRAGVTARTLVRSRDMNAAIKEGPGEYAMPSSAVSSVKALRARAVSMLDGARPLALLLGRLSVGLLFLSTGWGKVHDIPKVTHFFETLGIPMPGLNAVVV